MMKVCLWSVGAAMVLMPCSSLCAISPEVAQLVSEMRTTCSSVRGGISKAEGIYFVAIGRAAYRPEAVNCCRELAQIKAVKEISTALKTSLKSHEITALQIRQGDDRTEVQAFVSSLTESSIDQVLKGVQVISSDKNSEGEMEVVVYATAKMSDYSESFEQAQLQWGDKGVVKAVGIDADRSVAEKNALRSAVEQVAGSLVIGKVSVNERDELHKRLATTAGALVEEYRVISETQVEMQFRVEVIARVNKRKLYTSYRSYFKCLDNPTFCIVATDNSLIRNFTGFFVEKGFSLTQNPNECTYLVKLNGKFIDRPTPGNVNSIGTMLNLNVKIDSADGSKTLLSMNEKQSKDSETLTPEQRREEVSRRIFAKLESRLHQAVQDMVIRMLDDIDSSPELKQSTGTTI